jgi:iron complex outermembrane receptor protein
MASYDMSAWRFSLNANNLADKEYIAVCLSRGDCWFGPRRRIVGAVTYRW